MVSAALILLAAPPAISAEAPSAPASAELAYATDIEQSREFMTKYGVPTEVQDRLIEEALAGKVSLADTEGAIPTSVDLRQEADYTVEVSSFADGSIRVVEVEKGQEAASGGISAAAVESCSTTVSGSTLTYTGCIVHYSTVTFDFFFRADFRILRGATTYDRIDRVYGYGTKYAVGWQYAGHDLYIVRAVEVSNARASAEVIVSFVNAYGTVGRGCGIRVGADTYTYYNP